MTTHDIGPRMSAGPMIAALAVAVLLGPVVGWLLFYGGLSPVMQVGLAAAVPSGLGLATVVGARVSDWVHDRDVMGSGSADHVGGCRPLPGTQPTDRRRSRPWPGSGSVRPLCRGCSTGLGTRS